MKISKCEEERSDSDRIFSLARYVTFENVSSKSTRFCQFLLRLRFSNSIVFRIGVSRGRFTVQLRQFEVGLIDSHCDSDPPFREPKNWRNSIQFELHRESAWNLGHIFLLYYIT